jgi:hypothetical protein
MATATKIQPTKEQVETFEMLLTWESVSKLQAFMHPCGTMEVEVVQDGGFMLACFDASGTIIGDWIV